jgi:hypothetical protein
MAHKSRKDKPMNAYVASIISKGTPFTVRDTLYFQYDKPRMAMVNDKLVQVGVSKQRVKARELSS